MSRKKDRIADIADPRTNSPISSARDEIIRASGAFSTMRPLNAQDIRWLESKAFDSAARFVILSQILLPRICSIVGRGLTMEEMELLTGIDQGELKNLLRKPSVKDTIVMEACKVDRSEFVNIHLPFRKIIKVGEADFEERIKEPMLAPKKLVYDVRRNGYMTEYGHLWRYDYVSLVSGPLPTVYIFRSIKNNVEEIIEKTIGQDGIVTLSNDPTIENAEQEIASSVMETIEPLFEDECLPGLMEKLADFFSERYASAVRYAWRYRALNDMKTFNEIELLARPFHFMASDIKKSLQDESSKP
jgi:hypothetical protein